MNRKRRTIRTTIRSLLIRALDTIENNNNFDFTANGERVFAERLLELFRRRGRTPAIAFDVGANAGHYSGMLLAVADRKGVPLQLHAFEPAAACVDALQKRFANEPRVRLVPNAASNTNETLRLYFDEPGSELASLCRRDLAEYGLELGSSEEVPAIRLDAYIEQQALAHVHFVKIDVEGHEVMVLEGLGRYLDPAFVDVVQFEYGGANLDSQTTLKQLFSAFTSRGFRIAKIMKNGLDVREYEVWMENYRYSNYVAL